MTRCVRLPITRFPSQSDKPFIAFRTDFLITTSVDGHLKLWKKQDAGIEFVKHYRAHLATIVAVSASADGQLFASVAEDGSAKVFDVINFGEYLQSHCNSRALTVGSARHDQYAEVAICTTRVLLGTSEGTSPRIASYVCIQLPIQLENNLTISAALTRTVTLFDSTTAGVMANL